MALLLLAVVQQAHAKRLLVEHFTVDGTLIQAWANRRSCKQKQDPPRRGTGHGGRELLRETRTSQAPIGRQGSTARVPRAPRRQAIWAMF